MKKARKVLVLLLTVVMVLGSTLIATAATPRNDWCCPGAADVQIEWGFHAHDGRDMHEYKILQCKACGNIKLICK